MKRLLLIALGTLPLWLASCKENNGSTATEMKDGTATTNNATLELVYEDSTYQFTGIGVSKDNEVFINYPRWSDVYKYGVVKVTGLNTATPFPDSAINSWKPGEAGQNKWVCVQSIYFDKRDDMWILDPAAPMLKNIQGDGAKLVKMNKTTGKPERIYSLMGAVSDTSYVNDVRIDVERQYAYMTDSKTGGIVVLDLNSGKAREVLTIHPSTQSDPAFKFILDGRELMKDGKPAKFNSDGIALSPDGNWLYYKPLSDDKLYRIPTEFLRDENLDDLQLNEKVADLGHFATTDGMIFDDEGNLYFGDIQNYRIIRIDKEFKMHTAIEDKRLIWPDSYAIVQGYLYLTCSQIQNQPDYNNGVNKRTTPYAVYPVKAIMVNCCGNDILFILQK